MEKPNGGGGRPVGNTEHSWCRAVPGGTGIAVLAILLSKKPDVALLRKALEKLQGSHPVLSSKLCYLKSKNSYHFVSQSSPTVQINPFNLQKFDSIQTASPENDRSALPSPIHLILEHELNFNSWILHDGMEKEEENVMNGSLYELPEGKWAVALRLHAAVCDRRTAVSVLEELLVLVDQKGEHEVTNNGSQLGIGPSIENAILTGEKNRKTVLDRIMDLFTYFVKFRRQNNLEFDNAGPPIGSQVVRLKLSKEHTTKIQDKCKDRGIKLCGVLVASAMLAAYECDTQGVIKKNPKKIPIKTYGVITLVDCRSFLQPPLSQNDLGFYQSAILNTHQVKGESLWMTATMAYSAFQSSKGKDKHIKDMADLNLLMSEAIDKPVLTRSSALRTSLVSVFEDHVIDDSSEVRKSVGVEDYMGCASVHGIGPSLAIFDTVRDGSLDCMCVFPVPLYFSNRMQDLVKRMKDALEAA